VGRGLDARTVRVDGREVRLSNLTEALYPCGFTRAEVIDYYTRVAPVLLAHILHRPMALARYPDGATAPPVVETGPPIDDLVSLVRAADRAALELRPGLAEATHPDRPREVVFDLAPGPSATPAQVADVALVLRDVLRGVGLDPRVRSSGATGLHLSVALDGTGDFARTGVLARQVAALVAREWPDKVNVADVDVDADVGADRAAAGRVVIDAGRNGPHDRTLAPYSLQAGHDSPTLAAPLAWDEVERLDGGRLPAIAPDEALRRLERHGDLYARTPQRLPGSRSPDASGGPDPGRDLGTYRSMRDFTATPEPAGGAGGPAPGAETARFVVQQHDATRLHWDLRLEHDGVLVSWALPRGLPWTPENNHLAVHTEDHPIEYLTFDGEIPAGNYGGGTMTIWDAGTYEAVEFEERKVVVELAGRRARGRYALFATGTTGPRRPDGGRDWMIHRVDPPEDPARRTPPRDWRPMEASGGPVPAGEGYAFEVAWTGVRVLVLNTPGETVLLDGRGRNVSKGFPEVRRLSRALGSTEVILDGVVVEHRDGVPLDEPSALARRVDGPSDSVVRRLARDHPVRLVAFDLLWRDGHPRIDRPWHERRDELEALALDGPAWQVPRVHEGDGADLLAALRARGGGALVAKRRSSPYRPGAVTGDWVITRATEARA
jgi:bifunctional non-homologous end joining protein LigD